MRKSFMIGSIIVLALILEIRFGGCITITVGPGDAKKKEPDVASSLYDRGLKKSQSKEYDGAIADFTEAIRFNPRFVVAYKSRGAAWLNLGQLEKANADFNAAILLDSRYAPAYANRAVVFAMKKDYDKAIADLNSAIRWDENDAKLYSNRANVWEQKKDYDKAITDYNQAIQLDPKVGWFYANRAKSFAMKKEYDKAIADYNMAIQLDPKDARPFVNLAWTLATCPDEKIRNGKLALKKVEDARNLGEKSARLMEAAAAAHAAMGDFKEAIRWQEEALKNPELSNDVEARDRLNSYQKNQPFTETRP